jgi:hypothetical protein
VPKAKQQSAVNFLNAQLFQTPVWIMNQEIWSKIKPEAGVEAIKELQSRTLNSLLAGDRIVRLMESNALNGNNYGLLDLMSDLNDGIFSEIKSRSTIDIYRRNLQKVYVNELISFLKPGKASVRSVPVGVTYGFNTRTVDLSETDLPSVARGELTALKAMIGSAAPRVSDTLTRYHLKDLYQRIDMALDPK